MDFRYYGIAELAIVVSDVERAKEFYIGILGLANQGIGLTASKRKP